MTEQRSLVLSISAWILNTLMLVPAVGINKWTPGLPCQYETVYLKSTFLAGIISPFYIQIFIILILYGQIFKIALSQHRQIAQEQLEMNEVHNESRQPIVQITKTNTKAAKTLTLIIGLFILCVCPMTLTTAYFIVTDSEPSSTIQYVKGGLLLLGLINSLVNPIIYAARMQQFRKAFKDILKMCF